jgi:hypothetical protein
MSALTNINPAVDFELDKSAELYDEIHSTCEEVGAALKLYNEKYSYRSIETYMKERISFGEYLEHREHIFEKNRHANPPVAEDSVDALIEEIVEMRENRGSNRNEAQAMAELRPFNTTRTDKSHAQIMRELMSGQKHLIRLNAAVLQHRHQPSKLLRRVSKLQHKIREKEEAENALAAEFIAEAEAAEAAARAYDNDEGLESKKEEEVEEGERDGSEDDAEAEGASVNQDGEEGEGTKQDGEEGERDDGSDDDGADEDKPKEKKKTLSFA